MTWLQLFELLDRECKYFHKQLIGDKGKKIASARDPLNDERRREICKGVDLACEFFSDNFTTDRHWPVMEPIMVWGILERIEEAKSFAKFVSCPEIPRDHPALSKPMLLSDSEILRWILIDYWRKAGQWRWIYRIGIPYEN
jgi:hypothetical protein